MVIIIAKQKSLYSSPAWSVVTWNGRRIASRIAVHTAVLASSRLIRMAGKSASGTIAITCHGYSVLKRGLGLETIAKMNVNSSTSRSETSRYSLIIGTALVRFHGALSAAAKKTRKSARTIRKSRWSRFRRHSSSVVLPALPVWYLVKRFVMPPHSQTRMKQRAPQALSRSKNLILQDVSFPERWRLSRHEALSPSRKCSIRSSFSSGDSGAGGGIVSVMCFFDVMSLGYVRSRAADVAAGRSRMGPMPAPGMPCTPCTPCRCQAFLRLPRARACT